MGDKDESIAKIKKMLNAVASLHSLMEIATNEDCEVDIEDVKLELVGAGLDYNDILYNANPVEAIRDICMHVANLGITKEDTEVYLQEE